MAATESPGKLPSDRTVNSPVKVTLRLRGAVDRHSNQKAGEASEQASSRTHRAS